MIGSEASEPSGEGAVDFVVGCIEDTYWWRWWIGGHCFVHFDEIPEILERLWR